MKRVRPILSSDSDDEEMDISKIKNKYNPVKKSSKNESVPKRKKQPENQMTIEAAFKKVETKKRKVDNNLDSWIKNDAPKVVKKDEISPTDFFSSSKMKQTPSIEAKNKMDIPTISTSTLSSPPKSNIKDASKSAQRIKKVVEVPKKEEVIPKVASPKAPIKVTKHDLANIQSPASQKKKGDNPQIMHKEGPKLSGSREIHNSEEKALNVAALKTPIKIAEDDLASVQSPVSARKKASFAQFMHREGPKSLGSKEIPKGSPNCLSGLTFVITGVLDSIERDDAQALIERYAGKVTKAISGKTTYLLVGDQPGESKVEKAVKMKTKQINEDELFELIRSRSGKVKEEAKESPKPSKPSRPPVAAVPAPREVLSGRPVVPAKKADASTQPKPAAAPAAHGKLSCLLSDKYRPSTLAELVGQQGDRSPANKLLQWLRQYSSDPRNPGSHEGAPFRAALLSGPPGIGKTSTALIVSRMLGYNPVEFNASSVRSKNNLQASVAQSLTTTAFNSSTGGKHCVIMDEVDGMAGNEDRGGVAELIQLIKGTRHPIICICNDRQARKLQSLVKYVFDLRFRQLTAENMRAAVLAIARKERIALPEEAIHCIVKSSNFDMRQVLNNVQMWSAGGLLGTGDSLETEAKSALKEVKMGPFDVLPRVFNHEGVKTMSDKSDLFFQDYQLGGLFVQENYPLVKPYSAKNDAAQTMRLMSLAADSIATGDIVSRRIHASNNWTLLPTQALFSSVLPGEYLHGRLTARIEFPGWLGKFSRTNKNQRVLTSLSSHLALSSRGGVAHATTIAMDYGDLLVNRLVRPLRSGDVDSVLTLLNQSQLRKDDMDLLIEFGTWAHLPAPMAAVSTQTKSSLTRAYNKAHFKLPYATVAVSKKATVGGSVAPEIGEMGEGLGEDEGDEGDDGDEDNVEKDVMIVKKTVKGAASKKPAASKPAADKKGKQKATKK